MYIYKCIYIYICMYVSIYLSIYISIYLSIYLSIYITPVGGPGWVEDVDCTSSRCAPKTDHNTHIYGYIFIYIFLFVYMHMYIFVNVRACIYTYMCMIPVGGPGWVGDVDRAPARCAQKTNHNTYTHMCIHVYLCIFLYIYMDIYLCGYTHLYTCGMPRLGRGRRPCAVPLRAEDRL